MMSGAELQVCENGDVLAIHLHPRDREDYALGLHATQVVA